MGLNFVRFCTPLASSGSSSRRAACVQTEAENRRCFHWHRTGETDTFTHTHTYTDYKRVSVNSLSCSATVFLRDQCERMFELWKWCEWMRRKYFNNFRNLYRFSFRQFCFFLSSFSHRTHACWRFCLVSLFHRDVASSRERKLSRHEFEQQLVTYMLHIHDDVDCARGHTSMPTAICMRTAVSVTSIKMYLHTYVFREYIQPHTDNDDEDGGRSFHSCTGMGYCA